MGLYIYILLLFVLNSTFNIIVSGTNAPDTNIVISQNKSERVENTIEDEKRSSISLLNIQKDLWDNKFVNGFSTITFEDKNLGFLHSLNDNSSIEVDNDKYTVISRNKPDYDSLVIYYEEIYEDDNMTSNDKKESNNLYIVTNETENVLIIKSDKISKGSVCMGLLNGTEIWTPEFCELISDLKPGSNSESEVNNSTNYDGNSYVYCACYGSFIYTVSEPRISNRLLEIHNNVFNFPDLNNGNGHSNVEIQHVNNLYLKKVIRGENENANHADNIPFPPLHTNIGVKITNKDKSVANTHKSNGSKTNYAGLGDIMFDQDDLYKYYQATSSGTKYNTYKNGDTNKEYDNSRISEIKNRGKLNMEFEKLRVKNSIDNNMNSVNNFVDNSNIKINIKDIKSNMGDVKLIIPVIDSINILMELHDFGENAIFTSMPNKEKFILNFISVLSRALSINSGRIKVLSVDDGEENNSFRGVVSSLIKLTVNIKTKDPENLISKIKDMPNQISEFNKVFSYKIVSIEKNSGQKSISSEVVLNVENQVLKYVNIYSENTSNLLPIIFRMELKTRKSFMNQRDTFNLFEEELARSMNITKNQLDIPEFDYKQVEDALLNETFLIIDTEVWVHPLKPSRDEYFNLLSNIYSNIIHSKTSSFSSLFICIKYEVKQIPRIKNQGKNNGDKQKGNTEEKKKYHTNTDQNFVNGGRISKIGRYFKHNCDTPKNESLSGVNNQECNGIVSNNRMNSNDNQNIGIKPIVYFLQ